MRFSGTSSLLPPAAAGVVAVLVALVATTAEGEVTAMYIFGDSTFDVGNNNNFPGNMSNKVNHGPYGVDYPGGVPTGRFSNGLIGIDFMAHRLGFLNSPPAALSILGQSKDFAGLNFASGGSGILDTTGMGMSLSMNQQIQLFQNAASILINKQGLPSAQQYLSKSLFFISTGNNDLIDYFATTRGLIQPANDMFIGTAVNQYITQIRRIYDIGARKFAIFGPGNLGCIPAFRSGNPVGDCSTQLNALAVKFNKELQDALANLKSRSSGMEYSFADCHGILKHMMTNAAQFGFKEVRAACCGMGSFNGQAPCTPVTPYCTNRDEHLSWDYAHPTMAAYKVFIDLVLDKADMFTHPTSITNLAAM